MPIDENFLESDPRAYVITRRLDERIEEYEKRREKKKANSEHKTLRDILINISDIIDILSGFENPPPEIIEDLSQEGLAAIMKYYGEKKEYLLSKYCNNMLLSYEAIGVGHELNRKILDLKIKVEKLENDSDELAEYAEVYQDIIEHKQFLKLYLSSIASIEIKVKHFLFKAFENELRDNVIKELINGYYEKIVTKIYANIRKYCSDNNISLKTKVTNLEKILNLSFRIIIVLTHYEKIAASYFGEDVYLYLEKIDQEKPKIYSRFKAEVLTAQEINSIKNFITSFVKEANKEQDSDGIKTVSTNFIRKYNGPIKNDVEFFIQQTVDNALKDRSIFGKIASKLF